MVSNNQAACEPTKQMHVVILHWQLPEEWVEPLHEWVCLCTFSGGPCLCGLEVLMLQVMTTGQLNTILMLCKIADPLVGWHMGTVQVGMVQPTPVPMEFTPAVGFTCTCTMNLQVLGNTMDICKPT